MTPGSDEQDPIAPEGNPVAQIRKTRPNRAS
jgi:hypothetical protein